MSAPETQPRGFSLLHVSLSLIVLTLVASIAIPLYFSKGEVTLDKAAQLIARDIRYAQDLAVLAGAQVLVVLDPGGDGYRVENEAREALEAPVGNGPFVREYSRDAVFRGVRMSSIEAGELGAVVVNPMGLVAADVRLRLEFRGEQRDLTISAGEGDVTID
ncbi:MAG: hypothetical protein GY711_22570 [bacterium]|nr:hypothetical protein [bacterium]